MSKLLLFVIILSVIILGSYLNYPIENFNKYNRDSSYNYEQEKNGVTSKNYNKCIENAENGLCSQWSNESVQAYNCDRRNYIKGKTPEERREERIKLCLNNYQDYPRGFGCKSHTYGETGYEPDPILGCKKDDESNKKPGRNSGNKYPDYNNPDCKYKSQDECDAKSEESINSWKKKGISIFKTQNTEDYNKWLKKKPIDCNKFDLFNKNKTKQCSQWENSGISIFKSKAPKDWLDNKPTKCSIFKKIGGVPCGCCEGCKWSDSENICVEDF